MTITTFTRFCAAVFTFQMYSQIVLTTVLLRLGKLGLDWLYFISHWRIYTIPIGGFLTYIYGDSSTYTTLPPGGGSGGATGRVVEEDGHGRSKDGCSSVGLESVHADRLVALS